MKRKENDYFQMFIDAVTLSSSAADKIKEFITHFDLNSIRHELDTLHEIERSGDDVKHTLTEKLSGEFLPPIDREDIMSLSNNLDNVTDGIEDVLIKIYMYNITAMSDDAIKFINIVSTSVNTLKELIIEFKNFKKSSTIKSLIIDLNQYEEDADNLYTTAIHNLFTNSNDAKNVFAWTEVLHTMENCCDTCEHTSNLIETIIMKNS